MPYRQVTVSGFPAVALRSAEVELVVVPSIGAKITNLRRVRGREWLWRNERLPLALPEPGASFVTTADSGGWDECFPTVGPCPMPGALPGEPELPDHGELWSAPWECAVYEGTEGTVFTGRVTSAFLPCQFQRDIVLDPAEPRIRLKYRLRHLGERRFPFLWSAHPLLNVGPGTTLSAPGLSMVRIGASIGRPGLEPDAALPWPPEGGESFVFPERGGWALKVFGKAQAGQRVMLTDPARGERLEVIFGPDVPLLGLWINCGGWGPEGAPPYYNLGLEPCLGAPDRLDDAVERWNSAAWIEPGEEKAWDIEVRLE